MFTDQLVVWEATLEDVAIKSIHLSCSQSPWKVGGESELFKTIKFTSTRASSTRQPNWACLIDFRPHEDNCQLEPIPASQCQVRPTARSLRELVSPFTCHHSDTTKKKSLVPQCLLVSRPHTDDHPTISQKQCRSVSTPKLWLADGPHMRNIFYSPLEPTFFASKPKEALEAPKYRFYPETKLVPRGLQQPQNEGRLIGQSPVEMFLGQTLAEWEWTRQRFHSK